MRLFATHFPDTRGLTTLPGRRRRIARARNNNDTAAHVSVRVHCHTGGTCTLSSASSLVHFRIIAARAPVGSVAVRRSLSLGAALANATAENSSRRPNAEIWTRRVGDALRLSDTCARTCCASL
ncbi:hypothetical protein ACJJTC_012053 [Scirpophaga incertulas]